MAKRVDENSYSVGREQSAQIAERLRQARALRNESQLSLSRKIDALQREHKLPPGVLLQSVISDLENGKRNFQGWQLQILAQMLNVTEGELRDGPLREAPKPLEGALANLVSLDEMRKIIRMQAVTPMPGAERFLLKEAENGTISEDVTLALLTTAARPIGEITYDEEFWRGLKEFYERQLSRRRGGTDGPGGPGKQDGQRV